MEFNGDEAFILENVSQLLQLSFNDGRETLFIVPCELDKMISVET